jgi:hypothetical protein
MKQFIIGTMVLVLVSIASMTQATAQPRFEVPLRFTDGAGTNTLYFGILPGGHFCIDPSDTINGRGESYLPPIPPGGVFDARFICPRSNCGLFCFDQGSPCDFRPFTSAAQRDTFMMRSQPGAGTTMTFSWPRGLSRYFSELTFCNTNMLTDTFAVCEGGRIISGGLITTGVGQSNGSTLPKEFILLQNYPNPFNPSTRIGFSVPRTGYVSLKVFDLLGREVATLVNEQLGPGDYERIFNAEGLTSGVYFYRLQTDRFVQTRKLLLLR